MARYDLYDQYAGTQTQVSPEERMIKNERKRAEALMRSYQRSPDSWTPSMVNTLKQLTAQYQIPFSPPQASFLENLGAGTMGAVDALAIDMIPDKWYSSAATSNAAKIGKMAGLAGSFLIPGRNVASVAQAARAVPGIGRGLSAAVKWSGPGMASQLKKGAQSLAAPYAAKAGMGQPWVKEAVKAQAKSSRAGAGVGIQAALKGGSVEEILAAIQASPFSAKQKANMARGAAKKLFGSNKNNIAKAFIDSAAPGGSLQSGVVGKFLGHIQKHNININKFSKGNLTKLAGDGTKTWKGMKLSAAERRELTEALEGYDDLGTFLKDYWKSIAGGGEAATSAMNWGALTSSIAPAVMLGSTMGAQNVEE